jgi:DNA-binding MarR family transcriptional regulator
MTRPYYTVDNLERSNSVGFLIKRCGVLMSQVAERRFEGTSASFTQWLALIWLSTQDSQTSATQLSAEMGYDMGALTRVVDELERRGLVRRERSRRDRRAVEIAVTAAGRREAQSAKRVLVELLNQLVEPFTDAEIATLIGLLHRLQGRLQQTLATRAPAAALPARGARRRARRKGDAGAAP